MKSKKIATLISVICISVSITGCSGFTDGVKDGMASTTENNVTTEQSTSTDTESASDEVKPNTSEMVDKIAIQAKEDSIIIDDAKVQEAIDFIKDNYSDYFKDNETMEKTMYYGYLLDYAFKDDADKKAYSELGTDAYQVVKYVYRGAETKDDDSVKSNLEQIQKDLDALNN